MKKLLGLLTIVMVVSMLAACGPAEPTAAPEPTATSEANAPEPTAVAPEPTAVPTEEPVEEGPKYGGILKVGFPSDVKVLGYPPEIRQNYTLMFASAALESLLRVDETGAPAPGLATEWEVSENLDYVDLTLRQGVKFHDGTDWNAEAAKFNLDLYRTSDRTELVAVESVEVLDEYKVRLHLSQWDNTLVSNLAFFAGPQMSPTAYEENGQEWVASHPVGTGPFKFVSWERDVMIKFERFDDYWQEGKPYLDGIEFHIIADPMTSLAALQRGDIDVLLDVSPKDVNDLRESGDFVVNTPGASGGLAMGGDSAHPDSPFADLRVRQAVSYAINSQEMIDNLTYGLYGFTNQYDHQNSWGFNPDVTGYPYDPAKARDLLAEAGYADGLDIQLITYNQPQATVDAFTAVQGYLAEVGINAELVQIDTGQLYETVVGGTWENALIWVGVELMNPDTASRFAGNLSARCPYWKDIAYPDEYEQLLDEALAAPDFETKQAKIWELQKMLTDDLALVTWLWVLRDSAVMYPYVRDSGFYEYSEVVYTPANAWLDK